MQKIQQSHKTQKPPTLLQLWIWLVTRFICWTIFGCVGCVIVEIILVALYGVSALMILQTLLQKDYQTLVVLAHPNTLSLINHWIDVIPSTGYLDNLTHFSKLSLPLISEKSQHDFLLHLMPIITAALLAIKLVIIRLYLLMSWCQLFLAFGLVGLIDGLMQRHIRKLAAGRESALIYHNVKSLIMMSLITGVFIDLVLPISFNADEWILIISTMLFGIAIQITAKSFKKYL